MVNPVLNGCNSLENVALTKLNSLASSKYIYMDKENNLQCTNSYFYMKCIQIKVFIKVIFAKIYLNINASVIDKEIIKNKVLEHLRKESLQNFDFELFRKIAVKVNLISKDHFFGQKINGAISLEKLQKSFFRQCDRKKLKATFNGIEISVNDEKSTSLTLKEKSREEERILLDVLKIRAGVNLEKSVPASPLSKKLKFDGFSKGEVSQINLKDSDKNIARTLIYQMAYFSKLAYQLQEVVTEIRYDEKLWKVSYLNRATGLSILERPVFLFRHENTIVVSVPGTKTLNDWLSNMYNDSSSISTYKSFNKDSDDNIFVKHNNYAAHTGFLLIAESIIEGLINRSDLQSLFQGVKEINITGHSQGGSVATLLALYFSTHRKKLNIEENCAISCVTFASPRVLAKGVKEFYETKVKSTYRIINKLDLVTWLPFEGIGFEHGGVEIPMEFSLFKAVVLNVAKDNIKEAWNCDLYALSKIISFSINIFNVHSWMFLPHSMGYYEVMVNREEGKIFILRSILMSEEKKIIAQEEKINSPLPTITLSYPVTRYTPAKKGQEEEDGSLQMPEYFFSPISKNSANTYMIERKDGGD